MASSNWRPTTRDLLIVTACHAAAFGLAAGRVGPDDGALVNATSFAFALTLGGSLSLVALVIRDALVTRSQPHLGAFTAMGIFPSVALVMGMATLWVAPDLGVFVLGGFGVIQAYLSLLALGLVWGTPSRGFRQATGLDDWRNALGLWVSLVTALAVVLLLMTLE